MYFEWRRSVHIWIVLPFRHNLHLVPQATLYHLVPLKNITIYKQSHKHPVFFFVHFVSRPKSCEKSEGPCVLTPLLVVSPRQSYNFSPGFRRLPRTDQRSFQCPSAGKSARSPTYWPNGFGWWNLKEFVTTNHEKPHAVLGKKTHSFQQVQEVYPTQ